jgi:hypothetical protein
MLSRRHGKVRAVAKGVRRTSSKFGARLEPFMVADVQLYQGRSLDIVQQAESLGSYGADDRGRLRPLHRGARHGRDRRPAERRRSHPQQYLLLVGGCARWRRAHAARSVLDSYLLRAMSLSGWAPSLFDCARCARPARTTVRRAARRRRVRRLRPGRLRAAAPRDGCCARSSRENGTSWMPRPDRHRLGIRPRRRLRAVASRARHPLPVPRGEPVEPEALHAPRCRAVPPLDWTGIHPPRSRRAVCRTTSRSSWTATAGGPTAGD